MAALLVVLAVLALFSQALVPWYIVLGFIVLGLAFGRG